MDIMKLYKKTAEAEGLISQGQCTALEQWAINNEIQDLEITKKGNILVAKGVGHFNGVPFGVVGASFIMRDKLKIQYETEVNRGFKKFLEDKANNK